LNGMSNERSAAQLRAIIRTQTEIAASDLDPKAIMQRIAERAQDLTRASAGLIELARGRRDGLRRHQRRGDALPGHEAESSDKAETVGVLKVYSPEAHRFDGADVEALELLSELIAAHLSHATSTRPSRARAAATP
jgi:GAF domain-containing protein